MKAFAICSGMNLDAWQPETCSCQEFFEERAAIREYDAGFPRFVAEKKAREDVSRYSRVEDEGSTP